MVTVTEKVDFQELVTQEQRHGVYGPFEVEDVLQFARHFL